MKNITRTVLALVGLGFATLVAQAQPAPKILTIRLDKVFDGHYRTEEQTAKLRIDEQKAREELEKLNKEGNDLVEQYKNLVDQSNNPAATAEAKTKAQAEAQRKIEDIQKKQNEVGSFQQNAQRSLQQRMQTFRNVLLEEISKIASDIAKQKGANFLLDVSGPSLIGVSNVVYSDSSYDITDEVLKAVNKDRPAGSVSAPAASASGDANTIVVPGAKK